MTKNLRRCLRFFSYILEQRETNIVYKAQKPLFFDVQFSHSPLQNELTLWYNSLVLIIIYDEGKKSYDTKQEIFTT